MKTRLYNMETSFVLQVIMFAMLGAILVIMVVQKRLSKTPHEVAYKYRLYESGFQNQTLAIVITNAENKILAWNKGAEKLFGYTEEKAIGQDLSLIELRLPDVILHDTPMDTEAMHALRSHIPISLTVSEAKVENVVHYTAVMKGIRERKEKEAVILRELTLLNEGETIGGYGSWSWDIETNRVMVTEGFNRIFENEDFVTDVEYLMRKVYHLDRIEVQRILNEALEQHKDYELKYRLQKMDGRLVWLFVRGQMFLRKNGTLQKVVGTIKEIGDALPA